jgi:hypothetical protein
MVNPLIIGEHVRLVASASGLRRARRQQQRWLQSSTVVLLVLLPIVLSSSSLSSLLALSSSSTASTSLLASLCRRHCCWLILSLRQLAVVCHLCCPIIVRRPLVLCPLVVPAGRCVSCCICCPILLLSPLVHLPLALPLSSYHVAPPSSPLVPSAKGWLLRITLLPYHLVLPAALLSSWLVFACRVISVAISSCTVGFTRNRDIVALVTKKRM